MGRFALRSYLGKDRVSNQSQESLFSEAFFDLSEEEEDTEEIEETLPTDSDETLFVHEDNEVIYRIFSTLIGSLTDELSLDSTLMVAIIQDEGIPMRIAIDDINTAFNGYYPLIQQLRTQPEG